MEKYHDKIIIPYKSGKELLDTLESLYKFELNLRCQQDYACKNTLESLYKFEPIDYEEAMIEMQGFVIDKNITEITMN